MISQHTKNKFRDFLLTPITGGVIAGLAIIAGFIVSIYSIELKISFPLYFSLNPKNYGQLSIPSLIFWIIFFMFFILTVLRQRYRDKEQNIQREIFINSIQSLPPHEFALSYRKGYVRITKLLQNLELLLKSIDDDSYDEADKKEIEESIRVILDVYVNLAKEWDSPESVIDGSIIYRANIMFYYDINNLPTEIESKLFSNNNFFVDKNLESLKVSVDGILILENSKFTTTTKTDDPIPDDEIKPLSFPVTLNKNSRKRYQNIPGAPMAFVANRTEWIADTEHIIKICEQNKDFDGNIIEKIHKYYRTDQKSKSIISIPLRAYIQNKEDNIGVVNIYRNKPLMLHNDIRAAQFSAFMEPFNILLYNAINIYVKYCVHIDS